MKGKKKQRKSEKISTKKEKKEQENTYSCTCGKTYKSKPAVYTHIKTKHNNDKINFKIRDSAKGEIENNRAFRLEYIKFPEKQPKLMTLADNTCVKIAESLQKHQIRRDDFLLSDSYLSDSEEEQNDQNQIEQKIQEQISKYDIADIFETAKQRYNKSLQTFQIHEYRLNIRSEISKFFEFSFAWRIQMQILLHFVKLIDEKQRVKACQANLWKQGERQMKDIIQNYCREWEAIRN